MQLNKHMYT